MTLDVLHHDIGSAILCIATVKDGTDVRMSQSRQDLPFRTKPLNKTGRLHALAYHLDRYDLKVVVVGSHCQKNDSHPPAVEFSNQAVRPHSQPTLRGTRSLRDAF